MDALEKSLGDIFVGKLWAFPEDVKNFIVKVAPYLTIIGVVVSVPAVLALLGLGTLGLPVMMGIGFGGRNVMLSVVFLIATIVLEGLAIPGLFKRTLAGWRFIFWAVLVGGLQSLFAMDIGSLIIGTGLGLYITFQVRSHYH